jgi:hypothetical protein
MTAMLPSGFGSATFGAAEVAATSAAPHALDMPNEALVYESTESAFRFSRLDWRKRAGNGKRCGCRRWPDL